MVLKISPDKTINLAREHRAPDAAELHSTVREGFVFELYPAKESEKDNTRLGFEVESLELLCSEIEVVEIIEHNNIKVKVIIDPDGRKIELYEK